MVDCPWSDMITGTAWSIWHNKKMFLKMAEELSCALPHGDMKLAHGDTKLAHDNKKLAWTKWLAEQNSTRTSYNLHAVWIWYCKKYRQPRQ